MAPICVFFQRTPDGDAALKYAASLLRLGGGSRLTVYVEGSAPGEFPPGGVTSLFDSEQASRVLAVARDLTGLAESAIQVEVFQGRAPAPPAGAIVVHPTEDLGEGNFHCLLPFGETGLDARSEGPFLIPFGDGASGYKAARVGLPLAKATGRQVVFYHTTWRKQALTSTRPEDHVCGKANEDRRRLEDLARSSGVQFEVLVETADDVVEGIIHAALRTSARLVVMSRGLRTILGSYVTQSIEQSPVPLLVVAGGEEGR